MIHYLRRKQWPVQVLTTRLDGTTSIRVVGYVTAPTSDQALHRALKHWPERRGHLAIPTFRKPRGVL